MESPVRLGQPAVKSKTKAITPYASSLRVFMATPLPYEMVGKCKRAFGFGPGKLKLKNGKLLTRFTVDEIIYAFESFQINLKAVLDREQNQLVKIAWPPLVDTKVGCQCIADFLYGGSVFLDHA
jgi:hypothetical protein